MQQEELKELLAIFDQSTLTEFDLKDGTFELYFNKTAAARSQAGQVNNTGQTQAAEPTVEPTANTQTTTQQTVQSVQAQTTETAKETVKGTDIVSPIVGVVYLRPAPEKEDFKKVGDHVEAGEVVCIVEAMKVMNEITSDVSGEIVEVLVENEQVVEFDQPLFRVKEG
ncbi:acetyl-CoA carboxylase biotin carboxyl carrier protein [Tetragenococcus halophilus]|uniref:acetyl-CoA carboxylase biotin carboxyl carrier protein n=1 Tax=Tetragenococcus halophilus TaxID=51669 RepID=UPI0030C9E6BB